MRRATAGKATYSRADVKSVAVSTEDELLFERIAAALTAEGVGVCALNDEDFDVLVVGMDQADRESLSALRVLAERVQATPVVAVCGSMTRGDTRKLLDLGAAGIVRAAAMERALAPTVRVVSAGQICIPDDSAGEAQQQVLTTREKQTLSLVVLGLTNGQIAAKLFVAESTVKSHLSSAFAKLGVASRNEAVAVILDPEVGQGLGILTIPSDRIQAPA